jgi:hypothetical protein
MLLLVSGSLLSHAETFIYGGQNQVDQDSKHLASIGFLAIDSTVRNIYGTKWTLKIDPEVVMEVDEGGSDFYLPQAYIQRNFEWKNSSVRLGKMQKWMLGEFMSLSGVDMRSFYNSYKREVSVQVGTLNKYNYIEEEQVGKVVRALYKEQVFDNYSFLFAPGLFENKEDSKQTMVETGLSYQKNKSVYSANLSKLGHGNSGYSFKAGYSNSFLKYYKPLDYHVSSKEGNDFMLAFKSYDSKWLALYSDELNEYVVIDAKIDASNTDKMQSMVSTKIFFFRPYFDYMKNIDSKYYVTGTNYGFNDYLVGDLGMGIIKTPKRFKYENLSYGEFKIKLPVGRFHQINGRVRVQSIKWIDYDALAALYYRHHY